MNNISFEYKTRNCKQKLSVTTKENKKKLKLQRLKKLNIHMKYKILKVIETFPML